MANELETIKDLMLRFHLYDAIDRAYCEFGDKVCDRAIGMDHNAIYGKRAEIIDQILLLQGSDPEVDRIRNEFFIKHDLISILTDYAGCFLEERKAA